MRTVVRSCPEDDNRLPTSAHDISSMVSLVTCFLTTRSLQFSFLVHSLVKSHVLASNATSP
ncbi:hypothetical protein WOLCODRAFT_134804, partial [Wolfiporia cocos MD-104 SS10]